jgi:hypothetical protein
MKVAGSAALRGLTVLIGVLSKNTRDAIAAEILRYGVNSARRNRLQCFANEAAVARSQILEVRYLYNTQKPLLAKYLTDRVKIGC